MRRGPPTSAWLEEWEQRILLLKEAGCNAVASYIPWLWHELPDGTIDVTGATRAERDVAAFIDLCAEHGLWFVARPGPFVMAELKNEGLPYRLYTEHPEIVPIGWDGRETPRGPSTTSRRPTWRSVTAGMPRSCRCSRRVSSPPAATSSRSSWTTRSACWRGSPTA